MSAKKISYSHKISGMLASLTAFVCTAMIFFNNRVMTLGTLIYALSIIVPAVIVVGYLGFQIGKIFDSTKKKKSLTSMMGKKSKAK